MRLHENDRQSIMQTIRSVDPDAKGYRFGSRADDTTKSGVMLTFWFFPTHLVKLFTKVNPLPMMLR